MRETLDELIEVLTEMWDRSDNEETDLEDIVLPLKAAFLVNELDAQLQASEPITDEKTSLFYFLHKIGFLKSKKKVKTKKIFSNKLSKKTRTFSRHK